MTFQSPRRRAGAKARRYAAANSPHSKRRTRERADADRLAAIRAMYLRDLRSYSADLVADVGQAQELLQHGSASLTVRHYRTRAPKIKPAR